VRQAAAQAQWEILYVRPKEGPVAMRTDQLTVSGTSQGTDVEEPEELLIEEISIDGMCGVY
jgi:mycofactocin precursor